jgi:hypothetical protein
MKSRYASSQSISLRNFLNSLLSSKPSPFRSIKSKDFLKAIFCSGVMIVIGIKTIK